MTEMQDEWKAPEMAASDDRRWKDEALLLGTMNIGTTPGFRLLKAVAPAARSGPVSQ